jgi:hypothetical protein
VCDVRICQGKVTNVHRGSTNSKSQSARSSQGGTEYAQDWTGYSAYAGDWIKEEAFWNVPTVLSCSSSTPSFVGQWGGIGGQSDGGQYNGQRLVQDGITQE